MIKIKNVEALKFPMKSSWLIDSAIANPMSCYPDYKKKRSSWMGNMTTVIVKITTTDGNYGVGWVGGGKQAAASIIDDVFSKLLVGESPFNIEDLWEKMYRSSVMYGRKGLAVEAISGVDVALWDVVGKIMGQPVYNLLGGKTKDKIKVYATGNNTGRHKEMGFKDVKLAMPYSPADGIEGMKKNEEIVQKARKTMGDNGDIMLDCYMGWNKSYTLKMVDRLRDYNIKWIEEPLMPEHYDGYKELKEILNPRGILITGGEHEFTRYGFRELIEKKAVNILQPDVGRAGGISEIKKISAFASVYNIPVIPHGSGAPTYHLVISTNNCPRAEYIDIHAQGGAPNFINEPIPEDSYIELNDSPGFGYDLNEDLLNGENPAPIW